MDRDSEILMVAYYCSLGLDPREIQDLLHLSQSTVTRRLQAARQRHYLKELTVLSIPEESLEGIYPYLSDYPQAQRFQGFFGRRNLQKVIIVPNASSLGQSLGKRDTLELVGRTAAIHLSAILQDGYMVGVGFGRTVQAVAKAARELFSSTGRQLREIQFVPLIGGLSGLPHVQRSDLLSLAFECSASELAADLALSFKGDITGQLFLPAPAFVPQAFLKKAPGNKRKEGFEERIMLAREFVYSISEYNRIFGSTTGIMGREKDALISDLDIMISSVGGPSAASETGWLGKGGPILDAEERKELEKAGVVGDICGHFITCEQVADFPRDHIVSRVNRRVFGACPSDFQACSSRAVKSRKPGVIMVASSAHKAAAVLSAVRHGCVSTLIIDKELAEEIEKLEPGLKDGHILS